MMPLAPGRGRLLRARVAEAVGAVAVAITAAVVVVADATN